MTHPLWNRPANDLDAAMTWEAAFPGEADLIRSMADDRLRMEFDNAKRRDKTGRACFCRCEMVTRDLADIPDPIVEEQF